MLTKIKRNNVIINDFDPSEEINKLINNDFDSAVLNEIDESDMPKAKNALDWLIGKRFLNLGSTRDGKFGEGPYAKQIQIELQLHEDFCPDCTDPKLMEVKGKLDLPIDISISNIQDRVQLLVHGVCPKCKKNRLDFIKENYFYAPYELSACCGQRSGKSADIAMDCSYTLHRFLCLANPQKFFGLLPGSLLLHTFTATSLGHADELLWQPFKAWYDMSPWFINYHKLLDYYANKLGNELYYNKQTYYLYKHKRITGYCETPSTRGLRGPTRFYSAIDEIGWFDANIASTKVKISAEGIYTALNNSLETIRSANAMLREKGVVDAPQAIMANISSPSSVNDKIMRQLKKAIKNKRILAVHYATWEFNPLQSFEKLRKEHSDDLKFWRDFGASPPYSNSPYFMDVDKLEASCRNSYQTLVTLKPEESQKYKWVKITPHPNKIEHRLLTVDTGLSYNGFTLTVSHFNVDEGKVVFDAFIEVMPETKSIDFDCMFENAIMPLCEKGHVVKVVYDQWQSISNIHTLKNKGISAEQHRLTWSDFDMIQGALAAELLSFPKTEDKVSVLKDSPHDLNIVLKNKPTLKLLWQILTVRQVGRKVLKPETGDDDIFRSMCLAVVYWLDDKKREEILKLKILGTATQSRDMVLGTYRSRADSGGGYAGVTNNNIGSFKGRI